MAIYSTQKLFFSMIIAICNWHMHHVGPTYSTVLCFCAAEVLHSRVSRDTRCYFLSSHEKSPHSSMKASHSSAQYAHASTVPLQIKSFIFTNIFPTKKWKDLNVATCQVFPSSAASKATQFSSLMPLKYYLWGLYHQKCTIYCLLTWKQ